MSGKESDQVCQRKRRTGSPRFHLGTTLQTYLVTSPLLSISQSLCSSLRTEKLHDFIATTSLTAGVILIDLCHHFAKTTVQNSSVLRNGFSRRPSVLAGSFSLVCSNGTMGHLTGFTWIMNCGYFQKERC